MKSTDKIRNLKRYLQGKFRTKFGQSCVDRGNQVAIALHKASGPHERVE